MDPIPGFNACGTETSGCHDVSFGAYLKSDSGSSNTNEYKLSHHPTVGSQFIPSGVDWAQGTGCGQGEMIAVGVEVCAGGRLFFDMVGEWLGTAEVVNLGYA